MPSSDQRWSAVPSDRITAAILELRDNAEFIERFRAKIDTRNAADDECDIWTGAMSDEGYGVIRLPQSRSFVVRAHRVEYMLAFGAVPEDRPILDHVYPTCRYRFCVNEWHLEPVTTLVNNKRKHGTGRAPQRAMRWQALHDRDEWEKVKTVHLSYPNGFTLPMSRELFDDERRSAEPIRAALRRDTAAALERNVA